MTGDTSRDDGPNQWSGRSGRSERSGHSGAAAARSVLYVARAPFVSGAERALASMVRHLDRSAFDPAVVLGHETRLRDMLEQAQVTDVRHVPLAKRSLSTLLAWRRSIRQIRQIARDRGEPVLHANDVPSCQAISVVGQAMNLPRLVHVRWALSFADLAWWARSGAELIICISHWVKDQLGQAVPEAMRDAQVVVLPDAVDWPALDDQPARVSGPEPNWLARSSVDARGPGEPRPRGSTDPWAARPPRLGFAGQLIESKGLALVLKAMGRIEAARDGATCPQLYVAGEDTQAGGRYRAELESLAQDLGIADRVHWLGFLDSVDQLFSHVDAVVCPSLLEPLGLVPLEAARWRTCAIANRVGGLAETIQPGQTGILVEPDAEAWARVLRDVLASPSTLRHMGEAAWHHTRRHYSPARYQQQLTDLYHRAIQRTRRTPHAPRAADAASTASPKA